MTGQDWQSALGGLPERAPATVGLRDVSRFEQNIRMAAPHLSAPGAIGTNRAYVRSMWMYLGALEVAARQQGMNSPFYSAVGRTRSMLYSMGLAYPYWMMGSFGHREPPPPEPPPVKAGEPPFSAKAPDLGKVPPAESDAADDMVARYETSVARAVSAWKSADVMSQTLGARGMSLNPRITESVVRLQMFVEMADGDLRRHDWTAAKEDLEKVEYETNRLASSVGR
jgi:hypothetical protein